MGGVAWQQTCFFFSPNVLHAFCVGVQWQWYVECCWDGCFQWMRWCSRATRSFLPSPRCSWPVLWNWKLAPGCCWSEWVPKGIYHASCFVLAAQLARDHAGIESSWWTFLQTSVLLISLVRWVCSAPSLFSIRLWRGHLLFSDCRHMSGLLNDFFGFFQERCLPAFPCGRLLVEHWTKSHYRN